MKILTGSQMARWDRLSIRKYGISARSLMRRAAEACVRELVAHPSWNSKKKLVIACGPGNNGGDGMAIAGLLPRRKQGIQVFFFGIPEKLSMEARFYYEQCKGLRWDIAEGQSLAPYRRALAQADFIVDALFGIGLKRPIQGRYAEAIHVMNRAAGVKMAVDIPSGLDADTGEVLGTVFKADWTVTFEVPKWGQILPPAWDCVGDLRVHPIGLSRAALRSLPSAAEWIEDSWVKRHFKPRARGLNKGRAGKVLVVAGSKEMPGAGYLSAISALRAGAGLVTWALPEEAYRKIDLRYPEVILFPVPSEQGKFALSAWPPIQDKAKRFKALAIGPGLGKGPALLQFLRKILTSLRLPKVLDADALNLLSELEGKIPYFRGSVLTPHLLEMSRLSGASLAEIQKDPLGCARSFARRYRCWVLLKGYRSVVASPEGKLWINSTGGPNLATAGSGDVLTGVIAGLLAQGMDKETAVLAGAFLHGRAGDLLAKRQGDRGTVASDVAKAIPQVIRDILKS